MTVSLDRLFNLVCPFEVGDEVLVWACPDAESSRGRYRVTVERCWRREFRDLTEWWVYFEQKNNSSGLASAACRILERAT